MKKTMSNQGNSASYPVNPPKKQPKFRSIKSGPQLNGWAKEMLLKLQEIERLNPVALSFISGYLDGMIDGLSLKNRKRRLRLVTD